MNLMAKQTKASASQLGRQRPRKAVHNLPASPMDDRTHALLAGLAHELRNPLAAIAGHTELLCLCVHGPLLPKQTEILDRIRINQQHIAEIIASAVAYTDAVVGSQRMQLETIELEPIIERRVNALADQAGQRDLRFSFTGAAPDDPPGNTAFPRSSTPVRVDGTALGTVLDIVLRDAIESSRDGTITLTLSPDVDVATLTVATHGSPFSVSANDTLFAPFEYSADEARYRRPLALALPRARLLARAFGGEVIAVAEEQRRVLLIRLPRDG